MGHYDSLFGEHNAISAHISFLARALSDTCTRPFTHNSINSTRT